ncbi:MAG: pilus assembly protein TadG-related protein, partial [Acidimicrobiales bacterium]
MTHRTTRKKDERGAILVLSTVGLVLALIAGGLAVDLGFMAHEARDNQKVADLAALDA